MSKEDELKLKQLEREEKQREETKWTGVLLLALLLIAIVGTWVETAIKNFLPGIIICLVILACYLFLIGLNPLSKLSWQRLYIRKRHYKIQHLLERNGLPVDTPDDELPEHIRDEKVLLEGGYRSKIEKMKDRKFPF